MAARSEVPVDIVVSVLVGIAVGSVFGVLMAPAVYVWLGRREWTEASRENALADRLLERLDDGTEAFGEPDTSMRPSGSSTQPHGHSR
jgi:hypothetical protein